MPQIVIFEKRGDWARAMRRLGFDNEIVETRSLEDCAAALRSQPGCLAALETDRANFTRVADWLASVHELAWRTAFLVMIPPDADEMGWCLRQLGAVHVIKSPLDLRRAKSLVRRQLVRNPAQPLSLDQQIWNNLPWPNG